MMHWILIMYFTASGSQQAAYLGNYQTESACNKTAAIIQKKQRNAEWHICVEQRGVQ